MHAEYIQERGLESELLLLHFPTLRIQQLTLFGCMSLEFVIYNQFLCCFPCIHLSILQFVCCPEGPHSICLLYQASNNSPSPPLPMYLPPPPLLFSHPRCTAEVHQVCPSCASSRSCLPFYIIRPRSSTPWALTTIAQMCSTWWAQIQWSGVN